MFTEPTAAVSGCVTDWRDELYRRAASLAAPHRAVGSSGASPLDDLIDPGVVGRVLRLSQMAAAPDEDRRLDAARRRMRREWRRVRRKVTGRQLPSRTSPADFLRRYLVLRRFLEVSGPDSLLTRLSAADRTG